MIKRLILSISILTIFTQISHAENTENILDVSGTIRFQYTHNDYLESSRNKIDFSDAVLWLNYHNDALSGHLDYRVYEAYDKLGGIHFPANAWLAYQFTPEHKVTAGLQPVPIGLDRYYSTTYNLTQLYNLGLEELNNIGLTYQYTPKSFNLTAGYFFSDAGSYTGKSKKSSHYSSNLTAEPDFADGTQTEEKNQFTIKLDKDFNYNLADTKITTKAGASYLHSQIDNLKTNATGDRNVWTIFQKTQAGPLGFNIIYGGQNIKNKDIDHPEYSTFGFFDGYYNVANKANFLSTEINYALPLSYKNFSSPILYSNYSRYFKGNSDYSDSERLINGVYTKYKDNLQFYLEYINAKNDTAFGSSDGYTTSKDKNWNNMLFLSLGYYF